MNLSDALRSAVAVHLDRIGVNHEWTHKINPSGEVLHLHSSGSTVLIPTSTLEDNEIEVIIGGLQAALPRLSEQQGAYILKSHLVLERVTDVRLF